MGKPEPDLKAVSYATESVEPPDGAYFAGGGSVFQLEVSWDDGCSWFSVDWMLLPYVNPIADAARDAFRVALQKHLDFKRLPTAAAFRERFVSHIKSRQKARQLVNLYCRHFGSDHNQVSLSLYSGPSSRIKNDKSQWMINFNKDNASFRISWLADDW